jgi:hypothetical protein
MSVPARHPAAHNLNDHEQEAQDAGGDKLALHSAVLLLALGLTLREEALLLQPAFWLCGRA